MEIIWEGNRGCYSLTVVGACSPPCSGAFSGTPVELDAATYLTLESRRRRSTASHSGSGLQSHWISDHAPDLILAV